MKKLYLCTYTDVVAVAELVVSRNGGPPNPPAVLRMNVLRIIVLSIFPLLLLFPVFSYRPGPNLLGRYLSVHEKCNIVPVQTEDTRASLSIPPVSLQLLSLHTRHRASHSFEPV